MVSCAESSIALVSDNPERSARLISLLKRRFPVNAVLLGDFAVSGRPDSTYVVDADLSDPQTISLIKEKISRALPGRDKYFVINDEVRTDLVQANALGARDFIRKNSIERDAALLISKLNQKLVSRLWEDETDSAKLALTSINVLNDNLYTAIATKSPLPRTQAMDCCEYLIGNLEDDSLTDWLDAVRQHHSYTYRHSMIVSGLAVFFALRLGMRRSDTERIAIGALMHDVGKMRLPLGLLDKPGKLTQEERVQINKHPLFGAEILRADGQFEDEVVDIALHHHEFLDGSGYPDGLKGDQISDLVRIMTIVDVFAALIDERSYKAAMPCEEAYKILRGMSGKLDADIVRAFEPIAHSAAVSQEHLASYAAAV